MVTAGMRVRDGVLVVLYFVKIGDECDYRDAQNQACVCKKRDKDRQIGVVLKLISEHLAIIEVISV